MTMIVFFSYFILSHFYVDKTIYNRALLRTYISYVNVTLIYLHSIFEILQFETSSLMNLIFSLFQTWILQATAGRKIGFKLNISN